MSSRPSRGAARLAAILDALPDALVLVNANGTVVNANTIALEAFETPGTALVGRGLLDLLPEFDSRLIPGSMRRPDHIDPRARTKPRRMIARRTDGSEFPVEVTSANLETGQQAYDNYGYTGDELLMLVVRDLSGTVDTEAELARSQRQTEMILRAAAEGVVGTDTDGRIVLVNPAAAQILGYRASDLGGRELHTLVLHSRADGSPFPYDESPLADTLRSGRKHRVRGQVLFSKSGDQVPVDLTTAPVRDGDQLVGAVMTFTDRRPYDALVKEHEEAERRHAEELERLAEEHASELTALRQQHVTELEELREKHAEEVAADADRYAALGEREKDRYEALAARHEQLLTLLGGSLRGPLDELRRELAALAADDAGQLWPEANQVLHHLSAGYSRITTLIDNVLGYQRLDVGNENVARTKVMLDAVVASGVDGAVELIGPGRVQFAVHAPPIEAEVDHRLLAIALAHLVADVAGVDATGNSPVSATGGYLDNTVVVAAAQRGEVVRIEVRGPYSGGDPVHEPIVRGIVRAHGGVLQTHEVPGMSGSAYVLEVPIGGGAGAVTDPGPASEPAPAPGPEGTGAEAASGGGRRRARRSSVDAFLESEVTGAAPEDAGPGAGPEGTATAPTGRRRRRAAQAPDQGAQPSSAPAGQEPAAQVSSAPLPVPAQAGPGEGSGGTGRRRGRPAEDAGADADVAQRPVPPAGVSEGAVVMAGEHGGGAAASNTGLGGTVPPQGVPAPSGRRARRDGAAQQALPPALPAQAGETDPAGEDRPTGRRRRALASANERAAAQEAAPRQVFALPPADADRPSDAPAQPHGVTGATEPVGATAPPPASTAPASAPAPEGQVRVPAQVPGHGPAPAPAGDALVDDGRHDAVPHDQADDHTPPQPHPAEAPTGRRRRAGAAPQTDATVSGAPAPVSGAPQGGPAQGGPAPAAPAQAGHPLPQAGPPPQVPQAGPPAQVPQGGPAPTAAAQGVQGAPPLGQDAPGQGTSAPADAARTGVPGTAGARAEGAPPVPAPPVPAPPAPGQTPAGHPAPGQPHPAQPIPAPPAPQPWPAAAADVPGAGANAAAPAPGTPVPPPAAPGASTPAPPDGATGPGTPPVPQAPAPTPPQGVPVSTPSRGTPLPPENPPAPRTAQPLPAEASAPVDPNSTQGRAISVRTLGQGVPFNRQAVQVQQPSATPAPHQPGGSGRRRKLGTPPEPAAARADQTARPHPSPDQPAAAQSPNRPQPQPQPQGPEQSPGAGRPQPQEQPTLTGGQPRRAPGTEGVGRSYAIGAPDRNAAEGPEPLDGPGGAVEVADPPRPQPMDDELPPEPLDNPRRLLVWPAPDVSTQQALSDRGYRPVIVNSREEVDAQIAAFPAALFVDPLTGPITRTALQSLRQAAVAAEVPVLVTAGLGQASRDAAYGADPAVLLKALAPRDSEQHPPRVLLIEEHAEIALALTSTLERRGMQVARAASDADAVALAGQFRPNLVVMDLMQIERRQEGHAGIIDWLRANGQLNRTPLVVYTAAVDQADLPRLASGETVLFLAERSTSGEVQSRIVELLARIGTN
ncbi:PAS domain-containing protein [Streptomyces rochei]|uniref:hybrid sensor histidine kinase/response regulator n=1 Tax=Streptomyces TaxID=1883 RepID=UPI001C23B482|nr:MULTISPECIES: PAS domain-containing protein [unclassified Streptomyces]MBU8550647.1 PAS domain-containing protein [Streptomyces sp. Osf17]MBU8557427.1 PAS domain-containing protein [Streptomyces sp. Babs14]